MSMNASPTMGVAECMEAFRANNEKMSPKKFWANVENGLYQFVHVCPDTKRRTATIYKSDFIEFMHGKGVKFVLPFEADLKRKENSK